MTAAFGLTKFLLQELTPGVMYEVQIRAVDAFDPPNRGAWSVAAQFTTAGDNIAPSTPAAPTVSSSLVAVQVIHYLGKASGGVYNLESDLHHLDVHLGTTSGFTETISNKIGYIVATGGMIQAQTPAIKTFPVASTAAVWIKVVAVDTSGNKSPASVASSATAQLIDAQYITSVYASTIQTGNLTATLALLGTIQTAPSGARFVADNTGWKTYRPSGTLAMWAKSTTADLVGYGIDGITETFKFDANTGNTSIVGDFKTSSGTDRIILSNASGAPRIDLFRSPSGSDSAYVTAIGSTVDGTIELDLHSGPDKVFTPNREMQLLLGPQQAEIAYVDRPGGNYRGGQLQINQIGFNLSNRNVDGSGGANGAIIIGDNSGLDIRTFINATTRSELNLGVGNAILNANDSSGTLTNKINMISGSMTDVYSSVDMFVTGDNSLTLQSNNRIRIKGFWGTLSGGWTINNNEAIFFIERLNNYPGGTSWTGGETYGPTMLGIPLSFIMMDGNNLCRYNSWGDSTTGCNFVTDSTVNRLVRYMIVRA